MFAGTLTEANVRRNIGAAIDVSFTNQTFVPETVNQFLRIILLSKDIDSGYKILLSLKARLEINLNLTRQVHFCMLQQFRFVDLGPL